MCFILFAFVVYVNIHRESKHKLLYCWYYNYEMLTSFLKLFQ